ncbi:hypothetical protein ACVWW5_002369 [Bradyrhizobium sp. LM3.4]
MSEVLRSGASWPPARSAAFAMGAYLMRICDRQWRPDLPEGDLKSRHRHVRKARKTVNSSQVLSKSVWDAGKDTRHPHF